MGRRKALSLAAAFAVQCCNGGLYAWSAFVPALRADYGLSSTQLALVFSATMACFTSTMLIAGPRLERWGARLPTLLAGMLFAAGYLIAAVSEGRFVLLLFGPGMVGGAAIGLGYMSALSASTRLFPGRCGLVTGVIVAGFGVSGMLITHVIATQLAQGVDVLDLLGRVGVVYAFVVGASGLAMPRPEAPLEPIGSSNAQRQSHVLADPSTRALSVGMFASTFGGLLVVSHLHPLVLATGASPQVATWAVGAFALGNAAGRLLWGQLADRLGISTINASLLCLVVALLGLSGAGSSAALLCASAFLGLCFGAAFVVYAAQALREHGPSGFGRVYPWVFLSYGLAGIIGPLIGGWLVDTLGDYRPSVLLAALVTAAGMPLSGLLRRRAKSSTVQHAATPAA